MALLAKEGSGNRDAHRTDARVVSCPGFRRSINVVFSSGKDRKVFSIVEVSKNTCRHRNVMSRKNLKHSVLRNDLISKCMDYSRNRERKK